MKLIPLGYSIKWICLFKWNFWCNSWRRKLLINTLVAPSPCIKRLLFLLVTTNLTKLRNRPNNILFSSVLLCRTPQTCLDWDTLCLELPGTIEEPFIDTVLPPILHHHRVQRLPQSSVTHSVNNSFRIMTFRTLLRTDVRFVRPITTNEYKSPQIGRILWPDLFPIYLKTSCHYPSPWP